MLSLTEILPKANRLQSAVIFSKFTKATSANTDNQLTYAIFHLLASTTYHNWHKFQVANSNSMLQQCLQLTDLAETVVVNETLSLLKTSCVVPVISSHCAELVPPTCHINKQTCTINLQEKYSLQDAAKYK